jgi:hypothetical protein
MAKRTFAELISIARLKLWAVAPDHSDGFPHLARTILELLERGNTRAAEDAFFAALGNNRPGDYFYNMSASKKRRYANGLALAFCEGTDKADELFEMMKAKNVTGRTYTPPSGG